MLFKLPEATVWIPGKLDTVTRKLKIQNKRTRMFDTAVMCEPLSRFIGFDIDEIEAKAINEITNIALVSYVLQHRVLPSLRSSIGAL